MVARCRSDRVVHVGSGRGLTTGRLAGGAAGGVGRGRGRIRGAPGSGGAPGSRAGGWALGTRNFFTRSRGLPKLGQAVWGTT